MDSHITEVDPSQSFDRAGRARVSLPDEGLPLSSGHGDGSSGGDADAGHVLSADPADRPDDPAAPRSRRRIWLLSGAAALAVVAAGTAFVLSPYNTIYPVNASRLRSQGEKLAADAYAAGADLVAPAAKVAHAPAPAAGPAPRLEPPSPSNPDQELREIIALRDRSRPAPAGPSPSASPDERSASAAPAGAPAAAPGPDAASPEAHPAAGSPPSAQHPSDQPLAPARAASSETAPAQPASPVAPVFETGAAPGSASATASTGRETAIPASPSLAASVVAGAAQPSTEAAPARSEARAESAASKPSAGASAGGPSIAADPVAVSSELRAAPMTPADQVQVLETVARLAIVLRDVRAENAALKARVESSTDRVDTTLADFTRRLALAEARGAINAAMGATGEAAAGGVAPASAAPAERQPQATASGSRLRATPATLTSAQAPSAAASPAVAGVAPRYHVTAASPGLAMLSLLDRSGGEGSQIEVAVGDQVPGFGKVASILQRGSAWVVQTDKGVIQ